jgi:hypothetical protein
LQAVTPLVVQGQPSVGVLAVQPAIGTQAPLEQVMPAAQTIPSPAFPVALQTDVPEAQEVVPVLHGMPVGVQEVPCVQEQLPPLQARFVPQVVPLATGAFWSTQTGAPLAQDCAPTWQGALGGVQELFAAQGEQVPALQTIPLPHPVPGATFPVYMQTDVPELQTVVPVWQRFPFGLQGFPATQVVQLPPLQTRLVPQFVPF